MQQGQQLSGLLVAQFWWWQEPVERRLFGIEINDELCRVATMNMILHDDGHTDIVGFDALEKLAAIKTESQKIRENAFDLILTNPPFGAVVKETEKGKAYMEGWELLKYVGKGTTGAGNDDEEAGDFKAGKKSINARTSIKTEILFCERSGTS